jgi:hypothetical protein
LVSTLNKFSAAFSRENIIFSTFFLLSLSITFFFQYFPEKISFFVLIFCVLHICTFSQWFSFHWFNFTISIPIPIHDQISCSSSWSNKISSLWIFQFLIEFVTIFVLAIAIWFCYYRKFFSTFPPNSRVFNFFSSFQFAIFRSGIFDFDIQRILWSHIFFIRGNFVLSVLNWRNKDFWDTVFTIDDGGKWWRLWICFWLIQRESWICAENCRFVDQSFLQCFRWRWISMAMPLVLGYLWLW